MRTPRQQAVFESRREREFYRYYEPIRSLSEHPPSLTDLNDEESVRSHRPSSSPDKALTAFVQLGALRLGTRRAMLFFFDANHAYVLAEATRTLSLQDDSKHSDDDGLWLGHTIIPRGFSVCETTVDLPENAGSNASDDSATLVHVINDLREDTRFCDRPFVKAGPLARFYAGVPITTPNGINIGAYCVLDDKVREGLDESELGFLRDMSTTVMTHLEFVRAKAENQRGRDMTVGLGAFIEGKSNLEEWWMQSSARKIQKPTASVTHLDHHKQRLAPNRPSHVETTGDAGRDLKRQVFLAATNKINGSYSSSIDGAQSPKANTSTPILSPAASPKSTSSTNAFTFEPEDVVNDSEPTGERPMPNRKTVDLQEEVLSTNVRDSFSRAAHLIRDAVGIDGVLFLDASVGTFGGLVHDSRRQSSTVQTDWSAGSDSNTPFHEDRKNIRKVASTKDKPCSILAESYSPFYEFGENARSHQKVSEKFLRSLLRRYPHGHIWNFNETGDASSDDLSDDERDAETARESDDNDDTRQMGDSTTRKRRKKWSRVQDGRLIAQLFPGVRSLALVGMWDSHRERWFAGSIIWTYSPIRVLSAEGELNYLAAFCDVVMAEVSRLDTQMAEQAKTDFISSISHELRSPLHGILGSVECLQEQEHDPLTEDMIHSIESCGTTLLDIINHLLDFAKINHYTKVIRASMSSEAGRTPRKVSNAISEQASGSKLGGMIPLDVEASLNEMTEIVIETACTGFQHRKSTPVDGMLLHSDQPPRKRKVVVILDIDRTVPGGWRFKLLAGAWRRICINLCSNALKYTKTGFVHVKLESLPLESGKGANVLLTIKDSGIGMSRAYLDDHLFRAFSQENSLTEGTGLGMNLVAKIVKSQGGTIQVESEKGVGTEVRVTVPFSYSTQSEDEIVNPSPESEPPPYKGYSVSFVGFHSVIGNSRHSKIDSLDNVARSMLLESLRHICVELGMDTSVPGDALADRADLHVVTESEARSLSPEAVRHGQRNDHEISLARINKTALIVLCDTVSSARALRASDIGDLLGSRVEYIAYPFGPVKLAKSIKSVLASAHPRADPTQAGAGIAAALQHGAPESVPSTGVALSPAALSSISPVENSPRTVLQAMSLSPPETPVVDQTSASSITPTGSFPFPRQYGSMLGNSAPVVASEATSGTLPSPRAYETKAKKLANRPRPSSGMSSPPVKPNSEHSLLLVDDNHINLLLLTTYANKFSLPHITARDGLQAVQAYKAAAEASRAHRESGSTSNLKVVGNTIINVKPKPRAILMDINMPVMSGFEATRAIRAYEQETGTEPATIIALTGLGSADAQQEAYSSGVNLFLTKPVRLKELTKILNEIKVAEE